MKILLTPDKFKGSLSAPAVCAALARGLQQGRPDVSVVSLPLADGGDGSLDILAHYLELRTHTRVVQDPLGRPVPANYMMGAGKAYIELSQASGLVRLLAEERNCMYTSTYGTGALMADAIAKGAREIYLFIGGSATHDGGMGIAHALGYRFWDETGKLLKPTGENLIRVHTIDAEGVLHDFQKISIQVICDVSNPFYGKNGAAYVYAAQKGANSQEITLLDQGLRHFSACLLKHGYPDIAPIPGAGAAGGTGGGCMALLGAQLISGIHLFLQLAEVEFHLKNCDLVLTGEGKLDRQTEHGKVVSGVCQLAQKHGVPVIAVCGIAEDQVAEQLQIQEVYTVLSRASSLEEALSTAAEKLEAIGEEIAARL